MHIVQSVVLPLLLFLVAPFWNIQLKHKPLNWHHPIQCCEMKISKISDIYRKYRKYQKHRKYPIFSIFSKISRYFPSLGDGMQYQTFIEDASARWTMQQDGARLHTAKNTLVYLQRENVTFIEPLNSPIKPVDYAVWVPFNRWCIAGDDFLQSRSSSA